MSGLPLYWMLGEEYICTCMITRIMMDSLTFALARIDSGRSTPQKELFTRFETLKQIEGKGTSYLRAFLSRCTSVSPPILCNVVTTSRRGSPKTLAKGHSHRTTYLCLCKSIFAYLYICACTFQTFENDVGIYDAQDLWSRECIYRPEDRREIGGRKSCFRPWNPPRPTTSHPSVLRGLACALVARTLM